MSERKDLISAEEAVHQLASEMKRLKSARDLLDETRSRVEAIHDKASELAHETARLVGTAKDVLEALRDPGLSSRLKKIEEKVDEHGELLRQIRRLQRRSGWQLALLGTLLVAGATIFLAVRFGATHPSPLP